MKSKKGIARTVLATICACALVVTAVLGALSLGGSGTDPLQTGNVVSLNSSNSSSAATEQVKDTDGNLLIPFDLAYPEAFSSGNYEYQTDTILLKMRDKSGSVGSGLKKLGVKSLTAVTPLHDGTVWYRAALEGNNAKALISKARALPEVLMADFDYIYRTEAIEPEASSLAASSGIGMEELSADVRGNGQIAEQWYLNAGELQKSWKWLKEHDVDPGGDPSVIVAVIDTGVDYDHPDLKDNMWVNQGETPNDGIDNDGNGYVDDYYGYNAVAENGDPQDDHGHGTHVAGIIAASNNKIGGVGIAYNTTIMAVKAGQATGVFTQSDIAEAIRYAYQNGADVINMSFGGGAVSILVQDALTDAYTTATLVAAAGNDGAPNEVADYYDIPLPNYPAALSYVIGVMSVDQNGRESGFSNWDVNAFNSLEYEMYAPGEAILSTLPGQKYGKLSGTSMAAPIVSGAAALLRSYYKNKDIYPSKFIAGQLASTSDDAAICCDPQRHTVNGLPHNTPMMFNLLDALTKLPKPEVGLYDYYLFDSKTLDKENTEDGVVDAGETIAIGAVLRNRWGMSKDTYVTIDTQSEAGISNPYVEITMGRAAFEGVGTYSTKDTLTRTEEGIINGVQNPLTIKIRKNCPNDYRVVLHVTITCQNGLDDTDHATYTTEGTIEFIVRSGVILKGTIDENMTLTSDNLYIIPNSLYIPEGVTVKVEEGSRIQFWTDDPDEPYADTYIASLLVDGEFITEGSEDHPVEIFPSEFMGNYRVEISKRGNGRVELNYTTVTNPYLDITSADHCTFNQNFNGEYYYRYLEGGKVKTSCYESGRVYCIETTNSVFYKLSGYNNAYDYAKFRLRGGFDTCIFADSTIAYTYESGNSYSHCVFAGNNFAEENGYEIYSSSFAVEPAYVNLGRIWRDDSTGTTYMEAGSSRLGAIGNEALQALAKELGGEYRNGLIEIPGSIYVDNIMLPESRVELDTESNYQILPQVIPATFDVQGLLFASADESVATVSERGVVTPVREGEADIYVYAPDYLRKATLHVVVKEKVALEDFTLTAPKAQLNVGEKVQLKVSFFPSNTTEKMVQFESLSDKFEVDAFGYVTALAVGEGDIRATVGEHTQTIHLTAVKPVESISFAERVYQTFLGDEDEGWKPQVLPLDATNRNVVWQSSNPEIAYVEDGVLHRVAAGNATLRATVESTELFADLNVVVTETPQEEVAGVAELWTNGNGWLSVLEDGSVYIWGGDTGYPVPHKIMEGVRSAVWSGTNSKQIYIVDAEKNLKEFQNYNGVWQEDAVFNLKRVKQLCMHSYDGGSFYALQDDGTVWSWGNNDRGELGDGTMNSHNTPMQNTLKNIYDIAVSADAAIFLDKDGNVWAAGGGSTRYTEPRKILSGASAIEGTCGTGTFDFTAQTTSGNYSISRDNFTYSSTGHPAGAYSYPNNYYLLDGKVYQNEALIPGIENATELYVGENNLFIATSDGKLYGMGNNEYHQLGDLTTERRDAPVRLFFSLPYSEAAPSVKVDPVESGTLMGELRFAFDRALARGNSFSAISLSHDGSPIGITRALGLNELTITPNEGWTPGTQYTLTIPAGALMSVYGIPNEQITRTFTYVNETPIKLLSQSIQDGAALSIQEFEALFTFSCAVRGDNFDAITLMKDGVAAELSVSLEGNILKLLGTLDYGEYTLTIPAGALKDYVGGESEKIELHFTVVERLKLLSSTPENGAVRIDEKTPITLTYTNAQRGAKFEEIALTEDGAAIAVECTLVDNTLRVAATLKQGSLYVLTLPEGALQDELGSVNEKTELRFTTYAPVELLYSSLKEGGTVDLTPVFHLEYNGHFTVHAEKIFLKSEEGDVNFTAEMKGNILEIVPEGLADATAYTLTMSEGALVDECDVASAAYYVNFQTIDQEERFFWTEEAFNAAKKEWNRKGLNNPGLYECAILNDFNDTDVEHWLRIIAAEGSSDAKIGLSGTYWGTLVEELIERQIVDFNDFRTLLDIVIGDYKTVPSNTFPFVVDAYLLNSEGERVRKVSNEKVTFVIEFNRSMDTDVPLRVRFGSSEPFAEYEIQGNYVSPTRWEGTYTLQTMIENGNQFIRIENGRAADDKFLSLYEHAGRWSFEIDTAKAQELVMRAEATKDGISLEWDQDDFVTLAGYNVYRSDDEFGYYTRINPYVIPAETKEYFDSEVEPGKMYYYNFTVVQTDFTESAPSGKISVRSFDTMAPSIYHTPVREAFTGGNLNISALVTDNLQIKSAMLFYHTRGEDTWKSTQMHASNSRYTGYIPAEDVTTEGLEYYISVSDGVNTTLFGSQDRPYNVTVKQAVDKRSLGDVDGDGTITAKDALMLLQAVNGLYNLSDEEFARADINEDGHISGTEALIILQYVSGKRTSVTG